MSLPRLLCALLLLPSLRLLADENLEIAKFPARRGNMTATAISHDGKLVFTGEDDGLVTLWSVTSGTNIKNFMGHANEVFATALLPDGKRGVSCGDDNMVMVWDLATAKRIRQMSTGNSIPWVMSCSRDGTLAATGCDDGQIAIWNLDDGRRTATLRHQSPVYAVLFSPDDKTLAAGYMDGHVIVWKTSDWSQKYTLPSADQASVGAIAFSPDGRLLATGNQNGGGFVYNAADGTRVSTFAGYAHPEATPAAPVAPVFPGSVITPDNRSAIVFLCFSPDGSMLLAPIQDAAAHFWEAKTGRLLGTADWFEDNRFYIARYGFTFATAAYTPRRDYIVLTKENLAQVWRCPWVPNPIPQ
jgi:WD40 repeat protein